MNTTYFLPSLTSSFFLIFLSEISDKSFLLIMLMTSKIPLYYLYITSISATLLMNYISIFLGFLLPYIINETYVKMIAVIIFLVFGIFSFVQSFSENIELEFEKDNKNYYLLEEYNEEEDNNNEETRFTSRTSEVNNNNNLYENNEEVRKLCFALFFGIFLSDIGDKSQLATISISSTYNLWGVLIGTTIAFLLTIILAVSCGNFIIKKFSTKYLLRFGGLIFLFFAFQILLQLVGIY
jgi:putative Ca2+/H+ antiporter (TMEM165/GDT1 family)